MAGACRISQNPTKNSLGGTQMSVVESPLNQFSQQTTSNFLVTLEQAAR